VSRNTVRRALRQPHARIRLPHPGEFRAGVRHRPRRFRPGIVAIGDRPADLPRERFLGEPGPYDFERILVGLNWSHAFNEDWKLSHRFNAQYMGQEGTTGSPFATVAPDGTIERFGLLTFQDPGDQPCITPAST
ncbi:MAG: hypothetical protein ACREX8_08615, partial [Gammaproteobacteria bacterium]